MVLAIREAWTKLRGSPEVGASNSACKELGRASWRRKHVTQVSNKELKLREVEKDIPSRENTVGKGSDYQNNMVRSWDTKQLALTPRQPLFREWQASGLERKVRTGL